MRKVTTKKKKKSEYVGFVQKRGKCPTHGNFIVLQHKGHLQLFLEEDVVEMSNVEEEEESEASNAEEKMKGKHHYLGSFSYC